MYGVVNECGTGHAAQLPNVKVCGKTGTAQVAATEKTKGAKLHSELANNAWFVAFAPDGESGDRRRGAVRKRRRKL